MTRTVVHLLRHGEVDNPNKIMYGRLPGFHLSANGRRMAERAAKSLLDRDITYLVSSPLERARETAEPLASALDLPVRLDDRLIEADNSFQGVRVGNGPRFLLNPRCWPRLRNPARPSWGEPYLVLAARMWAATTAARDAASGHEAVCVSHQSPDLDAAPVRRGWSALARPAQAPVRARLADQLHLRRRPGDRDRVHRTGRRRSTRHRPRRVGPPRPTPAARRSGPARTLVRCRVVPGPCCLCWSASCWAVAWAGRTR